MAKHTINVEKIFKEYTEMRIGTHVIEEVRAHIEDEIIPRIAEVLEKIAQNDDPPRKTIKERDCMLFDYTRWWEHI